MGWLADRRPAVLLAAALAAACTPSTRPAVAPAPPPGGAALHLQHDLDALLDAPGLARGAWGAVVRSLDRGDTLYARNANRLLLPASTLKILTLAAAGERLGWDFRFETRLLALGAISDGTLHGDLFVVGSGDPTILDRDGSGERLFAEWAVALRDAGIFTIDGRVVGHDRAFRELGLGNGWAWDDLPYGYAARVTALQFNDNLAGLLVSPGPAPGAPAAIAIDPPETGLEIENDVVTGPADAVAALRIERLPGSPRLTVRGTAPLGGEPSARTVSVDDPTAFFAASLRRALVAHGLDVTGPALSVDELDGAPAGTEAHPIATHRSAPLAEVAVRLMKQSQNLHAETLLLTMGRRSGVPTAAGGARAVRATLEAWGIAPEAFAQVDGSGLSRYDAVTASALAGVLARVDGDPAARAVFAQALPIAGEDGTLEARFAGTPAAGNARAKTGSMSGVRALAGYVTAADGERLVFAVLGNNFDAPGAAVDQAIDACVVRLTRFERDRP